MEFFVNGIKNDYSNFEGKAKRKEFWLFTAFFAVTTLALSFITGFLAGLTSARCTNEENYLFQKLFRAVIGTNSVDHCARL